MPLSILRSMMKAPRSLSRIQKAVPGVSGQFTRQRLTSRQPPSAGVQSQAPDAVFLVTRDEVAVGLDFADPRAHAGKHQDLIADLELLQLGEDAVGAGLAVVVDPVVAVPATPAVAELHQPRPDPLGRGAMVIARVVLAASGMRSSPG